MSEENTQNQTIPSFPVSVKDLNELPENQRPYYEEKEGMYYFAATPNSEVANLKKKVDERSSNNNKLTTELNQFGDTPEARAKTLEMLKKANEKEKKVNSTDKELQAANIQALQDKITEMETKAAEAEARRNAAEERNIIASKVDSLKGLKPEYKELITKNVEENFKLENGKLVPVSEDGKNWEEFAGDARKKYSALFDKVVGTDSPGNSESTTTAKKEVAAFPTTPEEREVAEKEMFPTSYRRKVRLSDNIAK